MFKGYILNIILSIILTFKLFSILYTFTTAVELMNSFYNIQQNFTPRDIIVFLIQIKFFLHLIYFEI